MDKALGVGNLSNVSLNWSLIVYLILMSNPRKSEYLTQKQDLTFWIAFCEENHDVLNLRR